MAQYQDGETRTINGVTYVRTNGAWMPHVQSQFAAPTLPYEGPQAAANLQRTQQEVRQAEATAEANTVKARNDAIKSGIDVQTAQTDLSVKKGTPPGDLSKTGDAYLATLPSGVGDLTREMLNGKYKGAITTSRNPVVMQAALAAAHATNGNFDAGKYDERLALIKSLTDPNSQLGALNTALAHAGVLYDQAGSVAGGTPFGHTPLSTAANAAENWWNSASPAVSTYEGTVGKYGPEQAKAYGIGTGGERSDIEQRYSVNLPLDTKRALLSNDARLYAGKIASLVHGYDMLGSNSPLDYLSPEAKAALQKIDPETYQKILGGTPTTPLTDDQVQAEVKARIARGDDPASTIQWLTSIGRTPSKDTIAAILANRGNPSPDVRPPQPGSYADSFLGQGLSGANEGLAGVLGAPADLATTAINLVPKTLNAVANTNIPQITNPLLGSQQWKQILGGIGSIQPPSTDPAKQFVRRVGESVGAAAVPGMFAGSLPKFGAALLSGVGSGIGGATAQQVAPGNPLAEMGGEMVGGGLTGLGLAKMGQRAAQGAINESVPTVDELKQQASNLYNQAETRGVTASPQQTQQLADDFRKTLIDEGQLGPNGAITNADTNTNKAFNLIQQYAGQPMTPKQMNTVRTVLADSRQSADAADRRLGGILLDQFDNFASPLAPEFDQARAVASRYLQAQDLEKARELAGARASQFTGSGFENALRTEYRGLDRNNIKGNNYFSPDVTDAIQTVARGTPMSNLARGLGRLAPTGPVSAMGDVLPAMGVGAMTGSPVTGGMFGAGMAGAGILGRTAATRMGINAANNAELIARNGGALAQAPLLSDNARKYAAWLASVQAIKYGNPLLQQN